MKIKAKKFMIDFGLKTNSNNVCITVGAIRGFSDKCKTIFPM